jgi:hypothetical protein
VREGHEVHLLTLTRGGATKQRERLGLSIEEMGAVRVREMRAVEAQLGLASLVILDFPDGGLSDLDPRVIERAIGERAEQVKPDVIVTYVHHGNSVHPDHLVTHAVVKRVFCVLRDLLHGPKRLALFTLVEGEMAGAAGHLRGVPADRIGARIRYTPADRAVAVAALARYETYAPVIEAQDPIALMDRSGVPFVLFDEPVPAEPLDDLATGL